MPLVYLALAVVDGHPQGVERDPSRFRTKRARHEEWQAHSHIGTCPRDKHAYIVCSV